MEQIKRRISGRVVTRDTIKIHRILIEENRGGGHKYHCGTTLLCDVAIRSETTGKVFFLPMSVIVDMAIAEGIDIPDQPPTPAAVGSAA